MFVAMFMIYLWCFHLLGFSAVKWETIYTFNFCSHINLISVHIHTNFASWLWVTYFSSELHGFNVQQQR
jgi:hypothetical protein